MICFKCPSCHRLVDVDLDDENKGYAVCQYCDYTVMLDKVGHKVNLPNLNMGATISPPRGE